MSQETLTVPSQGESLGTQAEQLFNRLYEAFGDRPQSLHTKFPPDSYEVRRVFYRNPNLIDVHGVKGKERMPSSRFDYVPPPDITDSVKIERQISPEGQTVIQIVIDSHQVHVEDSPLFTEAFDAFQNTDERLLWIDIPVGGEVPDETPQVGLQINYSQHLPDYDRLRYETRQEEETAKKLMAGEKVETSELLRQKIAERIEKGIINIWPSGVWRRVEADEQLLGIFQNAIELASEGVELLIQEAPITRWRSVWMSVLKLLNRQLI